MTRLYDRIMRSGRPGVADPNLSPELLRREWRHMGDAMVFAVDDVVRFVFELGNQDALRAWEDAPYLAPPTPLAFVETHSPRAATQDGELRPWRQELPKAWGLLLFTADFKEDYGHLPGERWRSVASDKTQELFASVPIPPGRRDGEGVGGVGGTLATPVRYHLRGSLYTEAPNGQLMGPVASVMMAIQPSGSLARFEGGRPLRFMVPFSGGAEGDEVEASLARLAVELSSPLLFSLTFMKSSVATLEPKTFPEKLKRKQEKKHGRARADYRELVVEPFREMLRVPGSVEQLERLPPALHWVRGYTRIYTPEGGGPGGIDITELIIQAVRGAPRGSKKAGEIRKDYRVDEPKGPHRRPPYPEN